MPLATTIFLVSHSASARPFHAASSVELKQETDREKPGSPASIMRFVYGTKILLLSLALLGCILLRANAVKGRLRENNLKPAAVAEEDDGDDSHTEVLTPDTPPQKPKIVDAGCRHSLEIFRKCTTLYKDSLSSRRSHCKPLALKYKECRASSCQEEREEVIACIKTVKLSSKKNVSKWVSRRGKCMGVLKHYNQCRKTLAMVPVLLPTNPFKSKGLEKQSPKKFSPNAVRKHAREDDADYIEGLYAYDHAGDEIEDEANEVEQMTKNSYRLNQAEDSKEGKSSSFSMPRHNYKSDRKACNANPLSKWCAEANLCVSLHTICRRADHGPNGNKEDNSKYSRSKATTLLKKFKRAHYILEHQKSGDSVADRLHGGKLPSHVDDEDNSKLMSAPGHKWTKYSDMIAHRSFKPANLADKKFGRVWIDRTNREHWLKVPLKDYPGKYMWWEPNLDKTLPPSAKLPVFRGFKLAQESTSTGEVNALTIGSGHHFADSGSRHKPKMTLPNVTYPVDKTFLNLATLNMEDEDNTLDKMFESTIKKYSKK